MELLILDISDSEDEENDVVQDIDDLLMIKTHIESTRYFLPCSPVPKDSGLRELLWYYPDSSFRQIVRMDKASFVRLVNLIQGHECFKNNSRNQQEEPYYQLMVVLSRLGCNGNGASIGWNSRMAGISHGAVSKYTNRMFTAYFSCIIELFIGQMMSNV